MVRSYVYFKEQDHYIVVCGDTIKTISAEMMACLDRQYRIMGYMKHDFGVALGYGKVEDEIEIFMKKLLKKD